MRKFLILIFLTVFSLSYGESIKQLNTSDIRVEIASQINSLKEKKENLLKQLKKATQEEKENIKNMVKNIDEKIKRLENLINRYIKFTDNMG